MKRPVPLVRLLCAAAAAFGGLRPPGEGETKSRQQNTQPNKKQQKTKTSQAVQS